MTHPLQKETILMAIIWACTILEGVVTLMEHIQWMRCSTIRHAHDLVLDQLEEQLHVDETFNKIPLNTQSEQILTLEFFSIFELERLCLEIASQRSGFFQRECVVIHVDRSILVFLYSLLPVGCMLAEFSPV
jgi:hypothetical protein